jgi:hypothetical protein
MRKIIVAAFAIAVVLAVWTRIHIVRERTRERLAHIAEGMTQQEVQAIADKPRMMRPCYSPRPQCEADMVYPIPFDFVGFWVISLDHSGRVIEKVFWESP